MKKFLRFLLPFSLVGALVIPGACKKDDYISEKDFVKELTGEWYVRVCEAFSSPNCNIYWEGGSSLSISGGYGSVSYSIYDTALCENYCVQYAQYWTIFEDGDDLILEISDLCGTVKNYTINYSDYHYVLTTGYYGGKNKTEVIQANISLVCPEGTIDLTDFTIDLDSFGEVLMRFDGNFDNILINYYLIRY